MAFWNATGCLKWNRKWGEGQVRQARQIIQGKTIHIEKHGPEHREGFVLAVKPDEPRGKAVGTQVRRPGNSKGT